MVTRDPRVDTRILKYILAHRHLLQYPVVFKILEMGYVILFLPTFSCQLVE